MINIKPIYHSSELRINTAIESKTLEQVIERMIANKEPIKDGKPNIYTERKDGVRPEFDIRTDRWEVAINATDNIQRSYTARRDEKGKMGKEIDEVKPIQATETK